MRKNKHELPKDNSPCGSGCYECRSFYRDAAGKKHNRGRREKTIHKREPILKQRPYLMKLGCR